MTPVGDPFERLHRQQLLIIRKTSVPGVVLGGGALLVVLWAAFYWVEDEATRNSYLAIFACGTVMVGFWALALFECRRDNLYRAFLAQFAASAVTAALLFLFIEKGIVMSVITAFTGLCAGASILDSRTLRIAGAMMTATVLAAAAAHELQLVHPIAIPGALLYLATASAVASGFRTPISALSFFHGHLKASRSEALRLARDAEQARERADAETRKVQQISDELREFTYVISHDLRAPMVNLQGFSSVLADTLRDFDAAVQAQGDDDSLAAAWASARAEANESLHFINRSTEKLSAMASGLLELSRIDSKPQQEQEIALSPLLEQIIESLQHQIRERDISVHIAPLPSVVADPLRLNQVFSNLLDNAIKYMPQRAPRSIAVACEQTPEGPVFSVTDSGTGIAAKERASVFRPFRRLDPNHATSGEGLGLAAVKKIIERRGGRIWIEDAASGPGTCLRFLWPSTSAAVAPEQGTEAQSAA